MIEILFTIVHILICLLLVLTVLLQAGKGGGLAGSIGGGMSSSSVLGGRTASTFLTKATAILATAFIVSCLVQSVAFQTAVTAQTTATQRVMEEGSLPVIPPAPLGEAGSLLDEPVTEEAPAASAEAAPAAEEETGGTQ